MKLHLVRTTILGVFIASQNIYALSVEQIYQHIKTVDNNKYAKYDGITYTKPSVNILKSDRNWLIQTPNLWGHSLVEYQQSKFFSGTGKYDPIFKLPLCRTDTDCGKLSWCGEAKFTSDSKKLCLMPQYTILNDLATNIASANYSVDIAQLTQGWSSITSGEFTDTIKNALYKLAIKSVKLQHPVVIRMLEGSIIPFTMHQQGDVTTLYQYLKSLTDGLPIGNKLIISVASERSCNPIICPYQGDPLFGFSWSHAKFTVIDGQDMITGGQQYNGEAYLQDNPVNDSMIEMIGPIAKSATKYADIMWQYIAQHPGELTNYCYTYQNEMIEQRCVVHLPISHHPKLNHSNSDLKVIAMAVMKINHHVLSNDADQSELARVYAFKQAEHSIEISEQAIFNTGVLHTETVFPPVETIDGNVISSLAYAMYKNGVDVKIVTSNLKGGQEGWSSKVSLKYVYNALKDSMHAQFPSASPGLIADKLKKQLNLAYIDFNRTKNTSVNNHNKFWMIDGHIFYFGSHNIYPSALQQYGVIIDSQPAANYVSSTFWQPMWNNANPMVISPMLH